MPGVHRIASLFNHGSSALTRDPCRRNTSSPTWRNSRSASTDGRLEVVFRRLIEQAAVTGPRDGGRTDPWLPLVRPQILWVEELTVQPPGVINASARSYFGM